MRKVKNFFHLLEAIVANVLFGFPSRKLRVIGVTGTDGKTTTAHLIYHILKSAGKKVSLVSSVYADVAGVTYETGLHTTTPHAFEVQKFIMRAQSHGDEYFILETTSHAIDQYRVWGVQFDCGVLTNVTHEHLDYHHTYDEYLKIKATLLRMAKNRIVNRDDGSFQKISALLAHKKIITYGIKNKADINWDSAIQTKLLGLYHKQNILAGYACCSVLGMKKEYIYQAIKSFVLPKGRFDIVYDRDFTVIIDFAHTPHAIDQLLMTIKTEIMSKSKGRIIHIFGSAGLRDASKRPKMGGASARYADTIILTEEDYRIENVETICRQIADGVRNIKIRSVQLLTIFDRLEAIKRGISLAKAGDIVAITGKGHEASLCRGKAEYPWSDYDAVQQILANK